MDDVLNGQIFHTLREAQNLIEEWRKHDNTNRPHKALAYRAPTTDRPPKQPYRGTKGQSCTNNQIGPLKPG